MASTKITIEWPIGTEHRITGDWDSGYIGQPSSTSNEFRVFFGNSLIGVERNSKLKIIDIDWADGAQSCNATGEYTVTYVDRSEPGNCTIKLKN